MDRGVDGEIPETVAQRTERMRKTADLNFHAVQVSENMLSILFLIFMRPIDILINTLDFFLNCSEFLDVPREIAETG